MTKFIRFFAKRTQFPGMVSVSWAHRDFAQGPLHDHRVGLWRGDQVMEHHDPRAEELAEQTSRSIREDDSLMPGDVVSTDQGLFRFQGSPLKEQQPDDFVWIR